MIHKILRYLCSVLVLVTVIHIAPTLAHDSDKLLMQDVKTKFYSATPEYYDEYVCTAYDLSYQSCQKYPDHPWYGITASGVSLKDHSRESAMAIAVDPSEIPLGSKVLIIFDDSYRSKYNGIYTAVDTGGAINGRRIDIFFGDHKENVSREALEFGRTVARVKVLS